jgi:DNA-directed RNA polymerase subunit RPC12/RpoP
LDPPTEKHIGKVPENCPHCGIALSRWEQVLLNVDRALMCKNCWYRIIIDVFEKNADEAANKKETENGII